MEFRDFLRIRRAELDLSQVEIANRLKKFGYDISPARLSNWETGRNQPPWEDEKLRFALAAALDFEINEMMERLGFLVPDDKRSNAARRAADIIDRLPDKEREIALNFLVMLDKTAHGVETP